MSDLTIERILSDCNALVTDTHVVYSSGKHGNTYINKNEIFARPEYVSWIGRRFAEHYKGLNIDVVIGPVTGGAILSSWTAYYLNILKDKNILSVYADVDGDHFVIKRGYDRYVKGKNILVVEDVLTTGGSVNKVQRAIRDAGGTIIAIAAICNRGRLTEIDFGKDVKLFSLMNVDLESWEPQACPLCKKDIQINKDLGHG
jgi:orotate phosphoribosyltransferase